MATGLDEIYDGLLASCEFSIDLANIERVGFVTEDAGGSNDEGSKQDLDGCRETHCDNFNLIVLS